MPIQQTNEGLQIQPLSEIKSELETSYRDPSTGFGENAKVGPGTAFAKIIGIWSEREALLQQLMQKIQSGFNPDAAFGADLDSIRKLTGSQRNEEFASLSSSGNIVGTPGTNVVDGNKVLNNDEDTVWSIVGGPYVIPGIGFIAAAIQADVTGPETFLTSTSWTIQTPVAGWASFNTTADIDPEDIGRDDETDEDFRNRSEIDLLVRGEDLQAIKANVLRVPTVTLCSVFENRNCGVEVDGIPPGAFEVMVDGGDQTDIANAILQKKPPGAEAFGAIIVILQDVEGNDIPIGFTRPIDLDVTMQIDLTITGAEVSLPDNFVTIVQDAVLAFGNETAQVGQDVQPQTFNGVVYAALRDPLTGKFPVTLVNSKAALGLAIPSTAIIDVDNKSRADFDSNNILVSIV